jgi:NADH dehydrogenase
VKTITTHIGKPNPFGKDVPVAPYHFDQPELLLKNLHGVQTLYNTYWIRFERGLHTFARAVENTKVLFESAATAGVERIVHISVTKPSIESVLPYYRGKALQELALKEVGLPYTILRPTLVFGEGDILINNIAWLVRKFPFFPIFGDGRYRIQPIFAGDLAALAVKHGQSRGNVTVDAVGPGTYTFEALVRQIAFALSRDIELIRIPPGLGILLGKLVGLAVQDVLLTKDELDGLMSNKLTSEQAPNGKTIFRDWLSSNIDRIGNSYSSELKRHFQAAPHSTQSRIGST